MDPDPMTDVLKGKDWDTDTHREKTTGRYPQGMPSISQEERPLEDSNSAVP